MDISIEEKRQFCLGLFDEKREETEKITTANIEKYRKGNCRVQLTGQDGRPLAGAKVKMRQMTHDFKYGANIFLLDEFEKGEENQAYREMFAQYFNLATIPFYWAELEPEEGKPRYAADSKKIWRRPAPDLCLNYCEEKGISGKLHCLFYDKFIPAWLPKQDAAAMKRLYEKRFAEIAARYSGKLYEVEVTNEMLYESSWTENSVLTGERDIIEWCFAQASKFFNGDKLVINEGNQIDTLCREGYRSPYFMQLDMLLSHGTPIDKIGMQAHLFDYMRVIEEGEKKGRTENMDPELLLKGLNCLAELGKPLEITEVTIPTLGETQEDEEIQAQVLKELYTIWFSIPAMESVVYWNTVEGTAYNAGENRGRGGLFHRDFTPKKSALMLKKLFEETWHTELELTADENGIVDFRGFYGEYILECGSNKRSFGIHKGENTVKELVLFPCGPANP